MLMPPPELRAVLNMAVDLIFHGSPPLHGEAPHPSVHRAALATELVLAEWRRTGVPDPHGHIHARWLRAISRATRKADLLNHHKAHVRVSAHGCAVWVEKRRRERDLAAIEGTPVEVGWWKNACCLFQTMAVGAGVLACGGDRVVVSGTDRLRVHAEDGAVLEVPFDELPVDFRRALARGILAGAPLCP